MIGTFALLVFGVFACSTAVIFIKECTVHPVLLASFRLLVAAAVLSPVFVRDLRRNPGQYTRAHVGGTVLPGLFLAIHFISWIIAARMTVAANASLIVNLVPVVMPLFMFAMIRESLTRAELLATVLSLTGLAFMTASDFHLSREHFLGDLLCFASMLFFSYYLALSRKNQQYATIWLYVVPLYWFAGLFCLAAALPFANPLQRNPMKEVWLILGLGIVPTVIGHSTLNYCMKRLRGQVVSVVNMGQFVFAGTMAYLRFGEVPTPQFYVAAALLITSGGLLAHESARAEA